MAGLLESHGPFLRTHAQRATVMVFSRYDDYFASLKRGKRQSKEPGVHRNGPASGRRTNGVTEGRKDAIRQMIANKEG